jgi:glycosyltransferase involved in cell wall biosynthesis
MSFQVIAATPYWAMNGVNIFSANLVGGLLARGIPARILMTEQRSALVNIQEPLLELPAGIPVEELPLRGPESWGAHWGATIRYLEEHAPCVYIPNHDWRHSNVCPQLSPAVRVVGVVHSDDPLHYDHVARLGRYWDAIVTTTDTIAGQVRLQNPGLADRVQTIPIGVPIPATLRRRGAEPDRLRLVYQGELIQHQKRVFDLPRIVEAALRLGVPVDLTLIGGGADAGSLAEAARRLVKQGAVRLLGVLPHARVMGMLGEFDVFLLTSEFEGMPNALGEAMAAGCVPIVTDIRSGVRELVRDGETGYVVGVGDIDAFAGRLRRLHADPALRARMAEAARQAVIAGGFSVETMVERYESLFHGLFAPGSRRPFRRPPGTLRMPPYQVHRTRIGVLPSLKPDYVGYARELEGVGGRHFPPADGKLEQPYPNVVVSATSGRVSGVDVFSANLVGGLCALERSAHILMTCPDDVTPDPMPVPADIPLTRLEFSPRAPWPLRWRHLRQYQEAELRRACAGWIGSGQVRFRGILPNRDVLDVYAQSDVLLLTSEFEGLPVCLLEAMGQGCVPVVTDIPSGIPEVVHQGKTGYRIALGDTASFADCLARLHSEPALRQRLSAASHAMVRNGYSTEDMVAAYMHLFDRVLVEAEAGEFVRPRGKVLPPPNSPYLTTSMTRWMAQRSVAALRRLRWRLPL